MLKLLAMVLEMTGVLRRLLDPHHPHGSRDGAFFFLPLMVAASAAVKFKTEHVPGRRHRRRAGAPWLHRADGQSRRGAGDLRPSPGDRGQIHLHRHSRRW